MHALTFTYPCSALSTDDDMFPLEVNSLREKPLLVSLLHPLSPTHTGTSAVAAGKSTRQDTSCALQIHSARGSK